MLQPEMLDSEKQVYALASTYTYVWRCTATQFLVWYRSGLRDSAEEKIHFTLYDIASLCPMADSHAEETSPKKIAFLTSANIVASHEIPLNTGVLNGPAHLPAAFSACPELFVLVTSTQNNAPKLNLWIIDPSTNQMRVVSQNWFTNGDHDFGYEWITRVTRDPTTRCIVGSGIRIDSFLLNEDASDLIRWLKG